jgi:predicted ATPase
MIESISLRNFKAFSSLESLPLLPLTVLCGANSCGKSSILQSLLLWKQSLESKAAGEIVRFNGRFVHLGSLLNVIYGHDTESCVELSLTFVSAGTEAARIEQTYAVDLCLRDLAESGVFGNSVKLLRAHLTTRAGALPDQVIRMEEAGDKLFRISHGDTARNRDAEATEGVLSEIEFAGLAPASIQPVDRSDQKAFLYIQEAFDSLRKLLRDTFTNTSYLGPLREEPSRRYIYEEEAADIGVKGENAAYVYLVDRYKPIASPAYFIENDRLILETSALSLSAALSKWLSLMSVYDLSPDQTDEIVRLTLRSNSSVGARVNIADVGFGVSQVFPILLEGLRLPIGGTLILEQPEIHLHPKLELQLADFLLSLAMAGKRIIVETHSDHLVNRLVRRIVEDNDSTLKKLVGVYFVTPSPKGAEVESVQMDETRGIVNWPSGFFDQGPSEQEKIIRAGLDKRRRQRSTNE